MNGYARMKFGEPIQRHFLNSGIKWEEDWFMCGRYGVPEERAIEIDAQNRDEPVQLYLDGFEPRYNLAPTQQAPVLLREDRGLAVRLMRWGIIGTKGMHPNTMAESLEKWGSYFN